MISESYEYKTRTCFSCIKKGMFSIVEGPFLER